MFPSLCKAIPINALDSCFRSFPLSSSSGIADPSSPRSRNSRYRTVIARGKTVTARLQDIPDRVKEIADHGIHCGAAVALAVV